VESLRWILLAAGIAFVIVIYLLGRSRHRRNHTMADDLEDELPAFAARSLDDLDEGVGEVRIISRAEPDTSEDLAEELNAADDDYPAEKSNAETAPENKTDDNNIQNDIVVLYILAKPGRTLVGSQINSSAQAMGLRFGEMNVFHYKSDGRNVFSLANMLEPGSFDANTIHDLNTTGLTVFMQINGDDPLDDLTEMLQRSYQLAGLLDARLCNHRREPLTEQDAENYRTQVRNFIANRSPELSSET
jgi:cell division protein ZipA